MTLNEGAAAGLPLVATEAVGAAHDLIEPGVNGFRVPADDAGRAAEALRASRRTRSSAAAPACARASSPAFRPERGRPRSSAQLDQQVDKRRLIAFASKRASASSSGTHSDSPRRRRSYGLA